MGATARGSPLGFTSEREAPRASQPLLPRVSEEGWRGRTKNKFKTLQRPEVCALQRRPRESSTQSPVLGVRTRAHNPSASESAAPTLSSNAPPAHHGFCTGEEREDHGGRPVLRLFALRHTGRSRDHRRHAQPQHGSVQEYTRFQRFQMLHWSPVAGTLPFPISTR